MTDLFDFQAPPNRFAVLGNPVAHSQSPRIHQLFAAQFDMQLTYERIQADLGGFDQAVSHFIARRGRGLNVTVPFKVAAWKFCAAQRLSQRAARAQAVNTLRFETDGAVFGDNTDGVGLMRDLTDNLDWRIIDARVLLLGAGGAARGALAALCEHRAARIVIANRTAHRAEQLAAQFAEHFAEHGATQLLGCGLAHVEGEFDLIVNATSSGLSGAAPPLARECIGAHSAVYDMVYAAAPSEFLRRARECGATRIADGLGMLVEQAAESFYLWHDKRPSTAPVIEAVRESMQVDAQ